MKTTEMAHSFTWPSTDCTCTLYHLDALTMANKFPKQHFRTSTPTVVHTLPSGEGLYLLPCQLFFINNSTPPVSVVCVEPVGDVYSDLVIFDIPWGMMEAAWDVQMTLDQLVGVIRQVGVCQDHLDNNFTFVIWHQPTDTKMVHDAFKSENYKNITDFYWHKEGHKGNQIQRVLTPAIECATIAHYKSLNDCTVRNMPPDPRQRHNLITVPHITSFALDASQKKINAAEKPRPLAQFFVDHYCPQGGNVLVIGAGAGGDVFGALDGGANVVAVERDLVQFNAFPATAARKMQAEHDKMNADRRAAVEEDETSESTSQASASAATAQQQSLQQPAASTGAPPSAIKECDVCSDPLSQEDIDKNIECYLCRFKGPLCPEHRFKDPNSEVWYCPEHQGAIHNEDSQAV